jgi:hypothetical protein
MRIYAASAAIAATLIGCSPRALTQQEASAQYEQQRALYACRHEAEQMYPAAPERVATGRTQTDCTRSGSSVSCTSSEGQRVDWGARGANTATELAQARSVEACMTAKGFQKR